MKIQKWKSVPVVLIAILLLGSIYIQTISVDECGEYAWRANVDVVELEEVDDAFDMRFRVETAGNMGNSTELRNTTLTLEWADGSLRNLSLGNFSRPQSKHVSVTVPTKPSRVTIAADPIEPRNTAEYFIEGLRLNEDGIYSKITLVTEGC